MPMSFFSLCNFWKASFIIYGHFYQLPLFPPRVNFLKSVYSCFCLPGHTEMRLQFPSAQLNLHPHQTSCSKAKTGTLLVWTLICLHIKATTEDLFSQAITSSTSLYLLIPYTIPPGWPGWLQVGILDVNFLSQESPFQLWSLALLLPILVLTVVKVSLVQHTAGYPVERKQLSLEAVARAAWQEQPGSAPGATSGTCSSLNPC